MEGTFLILVIETGQELKFLMFKMKIMNNSSVQTFIIRLSFTPVLLLSSLTKLLLVPSVSGLHIVAPTFLNSRSLRRLYYLLAVPGHALLWLSLVKWKRKKRESARF
jgi:hypothetical protein